MTIVPVRLNDACKGDLPRRQNRLNRPAKNNVSFGGVGSFAKNKLASGFNWIDSGGFFLEFLIIDTLSMITPRVAVGLSRDRDKTGEWNLKAGAEEALREVLSGPNMFLIPMAVLQVVKTFKPASKMDYGSLDLFTEKMYKITDEASSSDMFKDSKQVKAALADKLFDTAFSDYELDKKDELKKRFNELINKSTEVKDRPIIKAKDYKQALAEFENHIALINNSNKKAAPTNSQMMKLIIPGGTKDNPKKITIDASDLFSDFRHYSIDIVEKIGKKGLGKEFKATVKETLSTLQKSRANTKLATGLAGFVAIGSFLLYLPKLCQVSKISPAEESARRAKEEAAQKGGKA